MVRALFEDLLAGLMYPRLAREQLRCACDVMNLFFIFDEHSDISEPSHVWNQVDILMDALRNPDTPRPIGEWVGGEIARQYVVLSPVCYPFQDYLTHHRYTTGFGSGRLRSQPSHSTNAVPLKRSRMASPRPLGSQCHGDAVESYAMRFASRQGALPIQS